jgi:glycosyltransferase involved in cell wall biosynthesis
VTEIIFNGKFLTASATGVHRVAEELIIACAKLLAEESDEVGKALSLKILTPKSARRDLSAPGLSVVKAGRLSGLLNEIPWEQIELPRLAQKKLLINLCNLGPVAYGNSITMIHDAQVYLTPASYSGRFRAWYKLIQPILGKRSQKILTVSEYSRLELARFGVAPVDKIEVIHNGCDHVLRIVPDDNVVAACGLQAGRYVMGLANTQRHKNISVLLQAFSSPALADLTLVLFGSASKSDFEAQGHRVPGNVKFVGRINDAELTGLIKAACAYACPSLTEGFGLPPIEAMALGCPAVVAPCGALPEVCGRAALYAEPESPEAWVGAIRQLADDTLVAEDFRRRGLEHAGKFTWKAAAQKLIAILVDQNTLQRQRVKR